MCSCLELREETALFSITANEARNFQKRGIDQGEAFSAALERCNKAVVEQSKQSKSCVEVAVYDLTEESFHELKKLILMHGFNIWNDYRHSDRVHSLTIVWG